jgi:hypothetical protein
MTGANGDATAEVTKSEGSGAIAARRPAPPRWRHPPGVTHAPMATAASGECRLTEEEESAAPLDGVDHLELVEADVTAVGITPCGPAGRTE